MSDLSKELFEKYRKINIEKVNYKELNDDIDLLNSSLISEGKSLDECKSFENCVEIIKNYQKICNVYLRLIRIKKKTIQFSEEPIDIYGKTLVLEEDLSNHLKTLKKMPFIFNPALPYNYVCENLGKISNTLVLVYKNFVMEYKGTIHSYIIKSENLNSEEKNEMMNILSFLLARPIFVYPRNVEYSKKIDSVYAQCDILDLLRLRKNFMFKDGNNGVRYSRISSNLKSNYQNSIYIIPKVNDVKILELYSASLKQIEPLSKCVFLYRVIEYAINFHYNKIYNPAVSDPKIAINHYYNMAISHDFSPIYYNDFGNKDNIDKKSYKIKVNEFLNTLKKESKIIILEWKEHSYLSDKDIGTIIYETGRNASAHGGSTRNARYDYSNNYFHMNNVNIFLELIARYLVEVFNPNLSKQVLRELKYLRRDIIKYNQ